MSTRSPLLKHLCLIWILTGVFLTGWAGAGWTAQVKKVFRQGLKGYKGVRDTWISTEDYNRPPQYRCNYGRNSQLIVVRDNLNNVLLSFDLSSIPSNSSIISATLSLYSMEPSSWDPTRTFVRQVDLFRMLRDWDEGNQVESAIDASGRHGATGEKAFDYFTGEGNDVPWSAIGMAAGTDYEATRSATEGVVDPGWYTWNIKSLVKGWIRGEYPNHGMLLKDSTGYEDSNYDNRTFHSSQSPKSPNRRPKLTIVYDPDTPYADAGSDMENYTWDGGPITLDASASHDRPGGDDSTLTYSWKITRPAYGSQMKGIIYTGPRPQTSFTPDRPGDWAFELTVTNLEGASATDDIQVELLQIRQAHPRIFITPEKLVQLKNRAVPSNPRWVQLKTEADEEDGEMHAKALVSLITDDPSYCTQALGDAKAIILNGYDWAEMMEDIAVVYDFCHNQLTPEDRDFFITTFNDWGDRKPKSEDTPNWGNYWPRYTVDYGFIGIATYGDSPRAVEWIKEYRRRFQTVDIPLIKEIANGGGWPEGMLYDWIANWQRVKGVEGWRTGTGEDLFESLVWFQKRYPYILLRRFPGVAQENDYNYHPYFSKGDSERRRGALGNYERIMALILLDRYPDSVAARQLQAYLYVPPTDGSYDDMVWEEFLWYNPDLPSEAPTLTAHYAPALGEISMRSGWPQGAADTDPSATHITFSSGDRYSYHQHYDQNGFTLFKYGDLLVDSGVYSQEGLSYHDVNYYCRTIAHNTLIVYNPSEDFSQVRDGAVSNDGGQRSVYPANRSPESVEYRNHHIRQYETGDMLHYVHSSRYTYALGDATAAYNNPDYNQTMDGLAGNVAKVTRFQRELLYLRPTKTAPLEYVVLYDRVGVTRPDFSGQNTKLLFHMLNKPSVSGAGTEVSPGETLFSGATGATAVEKNGKIFLKFVLPEKHNVRRVGRRGVKAFWVFDHNWDYQWEPDEPQPRPVNDFEHRPYGEWRLELEPADTGLYHNFLTVLFPTIKDTKSMPKTRAVTATGMEGVHIADPSQNKVALFSTAEDGKGSTGTITYTFRPTRTAYHFLADLEPNARYNVQASLVDGVQTVTLQPNAAGKLKVNKEGVLTFTLKRQGT
jgi:hypothetical protein